MDNVEYANINPITFCVFNTCGASLVIWPLTLMKGTHFRELSISKFSTHIRKAWKSAIIISNDFSITLSSFLNSKSQISSTSLYSKNAYESLVASDSKLYKVESVNYVLNSLLWLSRIDVQLRFLFLDKENSIHLYLPN